MLRKIGAKQLDLAQVPWDKLQGESSKPGACTPSVANASLTRDARRRSHLIRAKARAGLMDHLRNGSWPHLGPPLPTR